MRNPDFTLTDQQVATANVARGQIVTRSTGERVVISGTKRDGSPRAYVGNIVGLVGKDSHEAVIIETADGRKSMNLYNVKDVVGMI